MLITKFMAMLIFPRTVRTMSPAVTEKGAVEQKKNLIYSKKNDKRRVLTTNDSRAPGHCPSNYGENYI